jgi:AraC family transcriptional regulator of adaptative response/methylated-DNA-[protein]-cysteine methyltransferase
VILINRFTSPLGPRFVCATDEGICLLEFTDRRMLETEFRDLQKRLNATILIEENDHSKHAKRQLQEYFAGRRKTFTVPLHAPGTDFQQQVWKRLQDIPYGSTVSYQEQARRLGNPKAVRAVARANGMNRIAIIIPCHRVIGKDGSLTGYGGGLERKKWLLEHEQKNT